MGIYKALISPLMTYAPYNDINRETEKTYCKRILKPLDQKPGDSKRLNRI